MSDKPLFTAVFPYQDDVLSLPVSDLDVAAVWYSKAFGLSEIKRRESPTPAVVLERDGTQIGFAVNGGDPAQDGAAILVTDINRAKAELEANGVKTGDLQTDERNGEKFLAFFLVAPDGLCYYFHQPIDE